MKSILISIQPKWVAKILNGEKTIEVRKTCPQVFKNLKPYEGCSIDVYIYCTKTKILGNIIKVGSQENSDLFGKNSITGINKGFIRKGDIDLQGKVVAKFTLNKCQEWHNYSWQTITECGCVSDNELREYSKNHKSLYIWHIDNLVIFDEPKELSEFYPYEYNEKRCEHCLYHYYDYGEEGCYMQNEKSHCALTKAPESWQFIESEN